MGTYLPLIYVLLFTLFWSLQIFVAKLGYLAGAQLISFTLQSSAITLFLLGIYTILIKNKELKKVPPKLKRKFYLAGAIHAGLGGFLSSAAILYTSAINVAFIFQFTTVTTPTLAWIFLGEKMDRNKIVTITLVMIGIFLFVTKGTLITPHMGDIFALIACIAWSSGNVFIRGILKKHSVDADIATFFRPIGGLTLLVLFFLMSPLYPSELKSVFQVNLFDFHLFPYVFINALFIAFTWSFLSRALKVGNASYMSIMSSLSPVIVGILAYAFLHETLSTIQLIGAGFIVFGGLITHYLKFDKI